MVKKLTGTGNDADRNGQGHSGFGCYGLNVGIGDIDDDRELEIFVQTFDHGLDVFTVPGSGANCLLWPTARGGPWRMGQQNGSWMLTDLFADGFEFGHTSRWSRTIP